MIGAGQSMKDIADKLCSTVPFCSTHVTKCHTCENHTAQS